MTTWTTPRTWATGDLVTAADMNTHLRDNLLYLKDATRFNAVVSDSTYSSTQQAFVDVDSGALTLTVSTRGTLALVGFETAVRQSSVTQGIALDVTVDGVRLGTSARGLVYHSITTVRDYGVVTPVRAQHWLTNLAAGTHTLKLVWQQVDSSATTGYIDSSAGGGLPTRLWLLEFDI
jgi:hypothetical protein